MQVLTLPLPSRRDCTVSEISHSLLSYMAAPLVAQGSVPRFRESTFRVPRRCVRESQYGNVTFLLHTTSPVVLQASSDTRVCTAWWLLHIPLCLSLPPRACVLSPDNYKGLVWGSHLPRICHGLQRSPLPTQPLHLDVSTSSLPPTPKSPGAPLQLYKRCLAYSAGKLGLGAPGEGWRYPESR